MTGLDLVLTGPQGQAPAASGAGWVQRTLGGIEPTLPRWRAIARALKAQPGLWQDADHVLLLADDVQIGAGGVDEFFRTMRQHALAIAQPSLAWRSQFCDPTALHNPSFVYRHVNRIDLAAVAFSAAELARWLPWLDTLGEASLLSRLLPLCHDDPVRGAAVIDAVQAERLAAPSDHELAEPGWPEALQADGPHREGGATWGGLGLRGRYASLFDDTREECLGLLAVGYACAVQDPAPIGEVFLRHFLRSLDPPPPAIRLSAPPPEVPELRRSPIVALRPEVAS